MPTRSSSTHPSTAGTAAMADVLKHQLDNSESATIYVPLESGEPPSDAELQALLADGIHAEYDAVRGALAVRKATDDEIAEAPAETPTAAPPPTGTAASA